MKVHTIPGALAVSLAASMFASAQDAPAEEAPKTEAATEEKAPPLDPAVMKSDSSYGLGFRTGGEFGNNWGQFGVTTDDIDTEKFLAGFLAGFKGIEPEIDPEKLGAAMQALGDLLQEREKTLGEKNLAEGAAFLEENGKKEGIVTTDSGLQYQILEKGGEDKYVAPKEGEAAKQFMVNYKGMLIDGTEFDASPEGQPIPMTLQVVEGFKEALTNMPVGAKWKLFVPSKLAYGEQRRSADIGPNQTLIFELELVEIKDAPQHPGGLPFPMPGQGGQ